MISLKKKTAEWWDGLSKDKGEIMCCPALLDFVGKELERDGGVLKQLRKARGERARALKARGGGGKEEK